MATRTIIKSITIGVGENTLDDFTEVAALVGAPSDARVNTTGGQLFNPVTGEADTTYPYSVTFTWVETI